MIRFNGTIQGPQALFSLIIILFSVTGKPIIKYNHKTGNTIDAKIIIIGTVQGND